MGNDQSGRLLFRYWIGAICCLFILSSDCMMFIDCSQQQPQQKIGGQILMPNAFTTVDQSSYKQQYISSSIPPHQGRNPQGRIIYPPRLKSSSYSRSHGFASASTRHLMPRIWRYAGPPSPIAPDYYLRSQSGQGRQIGLNPINTGSLPFPTPRPLLQQPNANIKNNAPRRPSSTGYSSARRQSSSKMLEMLSSPIFKLALRDAVNAALKDFGDRGGDRAKVELAMQDNMAPSSMIRRIFDQQRQEQVTKNDPSLVVPHPSIQQQQTLPARKPPPSRLSLRRRLQLQASLRRRQTARKKNLRKKMAWMKKNKKRRIIIENEQLQSSNNRDDFDRFWPVIDKNERKWVLWSPPKASAGLYGRPSSIPHRQRPWLHNWRLTAGAKKQKATAANKTTSLVSTRKRKKLSLKHRSKPTPLKKTFLKSNKKQRGVQVLFNRDSARKPTRMPVKKTKKKRPNQKKKLRKIHASFLHIPRVKAVPKIDLVMSY